MAPRDELIRWLKDAHALENNVIQTLEKHIDQAQAHPEMQTRLQQHLSESRRHADMVDSCLRRHGENPSGVKEAVGAVSGFMQGITSGAASDTLVKNALGDFAAEHFEIASYTSLRSAAKFLGDDETARICDQILRDEEEMAHWLEQQIPVITRMYLGEAANEVGR